MFFALEKHRHTHEHKHTSSCCAPGLPTAAQNPIWPITNLAELFRCELQAGAGYKLLGRVGRGRRSARLLGSRRRGFGMLRRSKRMLGALVVVGDILQGVGN